MTDQKPPLHRITYRMQRADYVALSAAVARRPFASSILLFLGFAVPAMALAVLLSGGVERFLAGLPQTPAGALVFFGPLLLLGLVIIFGSNWTTALTAALIYKRNAIADKDIVFEVSIDGLEGSSTNFRSHIGWAAFTKLTEMPRHLVLQVSKREALVIPRRAFATEEQYNNILGFIRAQTGLSSSR